MPIYHFCPLNHLVLLTNALAPENPPSAGRLYCPHARSPEPYRSRRPRWNPLIHLSGLHPSLSAQLGQLMSPSSRM